MQTGTESLTSIARTAWRLYAERVAGTHETSRWWTVVAITASSRRQAERYEWEIQRRQDQGKLPAGVRFVVIPDPADHRIGSGGATIHALGKLGSGDAGWWRSQRVLLIHSGGDSRRLPIYSISGKLFSALPVKTPWGGVSTVFDEWMALSTLWVHDINSGLLVGSGDVVLTFDSGDVTWNGEGVRGVAMRQPADVGSQHGVYVSDDQGRVYAFLQKPSLDEVRAAGGLLDNGLVGLDSGLIHFAPEAAARLTGLASLIDSQCPLIDLYQHITMALTGQWRPKESDPPAFHELSTALKGIPFWVSTVDGHFTHVGTTHLFRRLMTEETEFSELYAAHQRLGSTTQAGLRSAGVIIDSVLTGGELGPGSLAIECNLNVPIRVARGSVLHGLEGIAHPVEVPEDTVVHQSPVALPDGTRGVVIRVYGVGDDPKRSVTSGQATWFGRPILVELESLGIAPEDVWPGLSAEEWTLWNARLFPVAPVEQAWDCARWFLVGQGPKGLLVNGWRMMERLSLAGSAQWADASGAAASHARRQQASWKNIAMAISDSGSDIRPLLGHAPGVSPLVEVGRRLREIAEKLKPAAPTEAASRQFQASLFFANAGLIQEAETARDAAFRLVENAVETGVGGETIRREAKPWRCREVRVAAPARIDLGGGWSDTPPFCLDWGGAVLNIAVELNGGYPIETVIRVIDEPVIRCWSGEDQLGEEYRQSEEILRPTRPGDPFSIPRTALRMTGLFESSEPLPSLLERMGGGLEIKTQVRLPMGSGLGTSSVLAASTLRAVWEIIGEADNIQALSDNVMRLEQIMTTGGGWQDQSGGIFPGAKLILSGPGLHQRLRVQPVAWEPEREAEFEGLLLLFYTGIRRIARHLLQTVVGNYLTRDTATVQVLHSIKTLAGEMSYAMQEGDWPYLGRLLDRHWTLNQILDPHTTNGPINTLLDIARPHIWGAKLAGAGGGGFLMLLAKDPEAAQTLRQVLLSQNQVSGGAFYDWRIARAGLRVGIPQII